MVKTLTESNAIIKLDGLDRKIMKGKGKLNGRIFY